MGTHSAASFGRRTATAVAEALIIAAIIVSIAVTWSIATGRAVSVPGARAGTSTSWITLRQVGTTATIQPALGTTVYFSTKYPTNVKNPRIEVLCYQSGSLVFGMAGAVTDGYQLGGGGSLWLDNGGSANCVANLFYFGQHAGQQTYNVLASTSFDSAG